MPVNKLQLLKDVQNENLVLSWDFFTLDFVDPFNVYNFL